jgi:hypothetical protein
MRFTASVTGKCGRGSDSRPILPGNFIRMDDKEVFRLYFENDWSVKGTVKFVYDNDPKNVYEEVLEAGDIFCHDQKFVFDRTATGEGHLLEIKFIRELTEEEIEDGFEEAEPFHVQFMLINNDYFSDGRAVQYGHCEGDGVVTGMQTDPKNDPDNNAWAQPRTSAPGPVYNPTEYDIHPPPPKVKKAPKRKPTSLN